MEIVYVRGGDKHAPNIAEASGMAYGVRHDYTPYAPVFMLDIKWTKYDWRGYLALIREYKPMLALAPDYEWSWQWTALNRQIDDLRELGVPNILVCPKFVGAVKHIPQDCVVAVSVPAKTYASFLPDFRDLEGRRIHLLGGSVQKQYDLIRKLKGVNATIFSVDGNYLARKAQVGQWWDGGRWVQLRGKKDSNEVLALASAKRIYSTLMDVFETQTQPMLLNISTEAT